ncbi:MAG: hypothetical protein K2X87_17520 [Gemmataceae bacterium]|nr:hypothetical protein [Gemmataceae bacterium]
MARSLLLLAIVATPTPATDFLVGAAAADVTPPAGYRKAGSYQEVFGETAADPILAKALYFAQGDAAGVIVVCDVCGLERNLTRTIREGIAKETGVPVAAVSVSATHTHGGPMHYDPIFVELFAERAKAAGKEDRHHLGDYPTKFVAGCVKAAAGAKKNAWPATLEVATGRVPGLTFNRRYVMKDGTVRMNPGKLNPDVVRPAGPVDEDLPLAVFADARTGRPFASLCSFAMHTTTYGGPAFSADHPGHLQTELRKTFGDGFVSVYAEGCAGDANQVNTATKDPDPTPEQAGAKLAAGFRTAKRTPSTPSLAVRSGEVPAPLRDDRPGDVARSKDILIGERSKKAGFLEQVEAYQVLLTHQMRTETGDKRPLPVQAFRLADDFAVVTLPHEVFTAIGQEVRRRSPFKHTLLVTIANEVDCYVPTAKAFEDRGSYEVANSPYKPGVGELLADEAVRLLKELAP